jgi:hypothetical protein
MPSSSGKCCEECALNQPRNQCVALRVRQPQHSVAFTAVPYVQRPLGLVEFDRADRLGRSHQQGWSVAANNYGCLAVSVSERATRTFEDVCAEVRSFNDGFTDVHVQASTRPNDAEIRLKTHDTNSLRGKSSGTCRERRLSAAHRR